MTIRSDQLNSITVIAAIAALIGLTIGFGVVLAIFVQAAKFPPVAIVGIVEASAWIRIEGLAAPQVLPGNRRAIAGPKLARFVHAITKAVATVIAVFVAIIIAIVIAILVTVIVAIVRPILVAVIVAIVIAPVLSGGNSRRAREH